MLSKRVTLSLGQIKIIPEFPATIPTLNFCLDVEDFLSLCQNKILFLAPSPNFVGKTGVF
jgi:hypothetical protein